MASKVLLRELIGKPEVWFADFYRKPMSSFPPFIQNLRVVLRPVWPVHPSRSYRQITVQFGARNSLSVIVIAFRNVWSRVYATLFSATAIELNLDSCAETLIASVHTSQ